MCNEDVMKIDADTSIRATIRLSKLDSPTKEKRRLQIDQISAVEEMRFRFENRLDLYSGLPRQTA